MNIFWLLQGGGPFFWEMVGSGEYILAGGGWWWIYFGWCWKVLDGGGWWQMAVGRGGWWWVVVGCGIVQSNPFEFHFSIDQKHEMALWIQENEY